MRRMLMSLILMVLSACQPVTVQVVTVTPLPATQTPYVLVVTATSGATDAPALPSATTAPATAVATSVTSVPTKEAYRPHGGCAALNRYWDDLLAGCAVNRNYLLNNQFVTVDGVDVPKFWTAIKTQLPVSCVANRCEVALSQNATPQADTSYQQVLENIEPGQCYLAKLSGSFRVQGTLSPWPENILFAGANNNMQAIDRNGAQPSAGDANFLKSTYENTWPMIGTNNPTPTLTFSVRRQWAVVRAGSWISITSMVLYAAPADFCASGAIQLE